VNKRRFPVSFPRFTVVFPDFQRNNTQGGDYPKSAISMKTDFLEKHNVFGSCRQTGEKRSGSTGRRTRAHALMSGLCRRKRRCATRRYLPRCHRFTYLPTWATFFVMLNMWLSFW